MVPGEVCAERAERRNHGHIGKPCESFEGISVAPEYQERFEQRAVEAIDYYRD